MSFEGTIRKHQKLNLSYSSTSFPSTTILYASIMENSQLECKTLVYSSALMEHVLKDSTIPSFKSLVAFESFPSRVEPCLIS